jgi:hypothetical protein
MKKVIKLTESELTNLIKNIISEVNNMVDDNWMIIKEKLKSYDPQSVSITYEGRDIEKLSFGIYKRSRYDWGLSVDSDGEIDFQTFSIDKSKLYAGIIKKYGLTIDENDMYSVIAKRYIDSQKVDISNPNKVITLMTELLNTLSKK